MKIKIIAGITKDNELYTLEINKESLYQKKFSMSGSTYSLISLNDAIEKNRSYLEDGTSMWRDAVANERTELGFEDWVDYVIDTDGNINILDINTELTTELEGVDFLFENQAGGQHKEKDLAHYFIDQTEFNILMSIWDTYHLKSNVKMSETENKVIENMLELGYYKSEKSQDKNDILIKAINILN